MKTFPQTGSVLAALFLLFIACDTPDDNNTDNNVDPDVIKAQNNKAIYNQLLLGEWVQWDCRPKSQFGGAVFSNYEEFIMPDGLNIEFKENEVRLPRPPSYIIGNNSAYDRDSNLVRFTWPIHNYSTLFDYTDPVSKNKYTGLQKIEDNSIYDGNYEGYLNLKLENGNSVVYNLSYGKSNYGYGFRDNAFSNILTVGSSHFKKKGNNNGNNGNGNNAVNISGSYRFTSSGYTHTLTFNTNGTFYFAGGSGLTSQDKSGTWSSENSTLTMSITSPYPLSEDFSVSSNGNSFTLTLQGNNPVSQILSIFTIVDKTLTMTKN